MPTDIVPAPFLQLPLNAMDDMLVGSIKVEASLRAGTPVFQPGLLARAHRGALYVGDISWIDSEASNILLQVISYGCVQVEREGLPVQYPCRPLFIATPTPNEGSVREHLSYRIAISLSTDARLSLSTDARLSLDQRVQVVQNVLAVHPPIVHRKSIDLGAPRSRTVAACRRETGRY